MSDYSSDSEIDSKDNTSNKSSSNDDIKIENKVNVHIDDDFLSGLEEQENVISITSDPVKHHDQVNFTNEENELKKKVDHDMKSVEGIQSLKIQNSE